MHTDTQRQARKDRADEYNAHKAENPEMYREMRNEVMQDQINDLMAEGMDKEEAVQYLLDNPL